jgi:hypothetical protein
VHIEICEVNDEVPLKVIETKLYHIRLDINDHNSYLLCITCRNVPFLLLLFSENYVNHSITHNSRRIGNLYLLSLIIKVNNKETLIHFVIMPLGIL